MQKQIFSITLVLLGSAVLLSLASCGGSDEVIDGQITVAEDADLAWRELMSEGDELTPIDGESQAAFFVRQVEINSQLLRERGLQFWLNYPDDPRRYEWLQLTVHMPPHYPIDISAWADSELDPISPNPLPVDAEKISFWESHYPSLRDEFWNAPQVTAEDRRFLWFGEIVQGIDDLSARRARGDDTTSNGWLAEVVAFYDVYKNELNVLDRERAGLFTDTLWRTVFETHTEDLGVSSEELFEFLVALDATQSGASKKYDGSIPELNDFMTPGTSRIDRMRTYLSESGGLPIDDPRASARSDKDHDMARVEFGYEYLRSRGRFDPKPGPSMIIYWHYTVLNRRVWQDFARSVLAGHSSDLDANRRLLSAINLEPRFYPQRPFSAAQALAFDANNATSKLKINTVALSAWKAAFDQLWSVVMDNPDTSLEERKLLVEQKIISGRNQLLYTSNKTAKQEISSHLLDEIYDFYMSFKDARSASAYVSSIARKGRSLYGLTQDEIDGFLDRFAGFEEPAFDQVLAAYSNRVELAENPIKFTAVTMDGENFDIASLRGKIVLIDHWNTGCSSCIEAMPRINDVFLEYRPKGFEVVSIAYDGTSRRKLVERIKGELGLDDWVSINGEPIREEMFEKYDIWAFPQYMLLNRDGTLFADTDDVDLGRNLQSLLEQMLTMEDMQ